MTSETRTVVFESVVQPFYVVLTFHLVGDSGQVSVNFSVRSHTPQPMGAMLRVTAVFQSWVSSIVDGAFPPLPQGWRVQDGAKEGATSSTPDHLH